MGLVFPWKKDFDFLEKVKKRTGIEKKLYELGQQVVQGCGFELYALEYINGEGVLRVFIQDPKTLTANLDHCATVDRAFTEHIESLEWMPKTLTLEVSSPGIYRDIKEGRQFPFAQGQRIAVTLMAPLEASELQGIEESLQEPMLREKKGCWYLQSCEEVDLVFSLDKEGKKSFHVPLEKIKRANVEPIWEEIKEPETNS